MTENAISEGGNWLNGLAVGLDWTNVQTTPGFAHATTITLANTDSTAVLIGTWAQNQSATATVVINANPATIEEIELRLNTTITPQSITGYELNFQTSGGITIVRWNGAVGDFTIIKPIVGLPGGALVTGDVISATNMNGLITCYVNGVQVSQVTDTTYTGGSPGIGFYYAPPGTITDIGVASFTATD